MDTLTTLSTIVSAIGIFLKTWWWLVLPIILYFPAKFLYKWWLVWEVWYKELNWIILEIIPPSEVEKPFKAMEDVFTTLWPMYDGPVWREVWCEGEFEKGPFWFSFEIVSIGGKVHFYLRLLDNFRNMAEGIIQTHYPDAEIFEVEDYTKNVPQNLPNDEYDFYGEDYVLVNDYAYPIKTYKYFEPAAPEAVEGEKKVDPIHNLLETMVKLKKDEQFWLQITPIPITEKEVPWVAHGRELADKLARREAKAKEKSISGELFNLLATGKPPFEEKKEELRELIPPEMKLTPGERETLKDVEDKITGYGFNTFIRGIYIYKRGCNIPFHSKIARNYLSSHFFKKNFLLYSNRTRTKVHHFFRRRRIYQRKRSMFEKYLKRFPSSYPKMIKTGKGNKSDLTTILNSEELATIFHFPTKASILPPGVPRVFAKKRGAPPGIPTE